MSTGMGGPPKYSGPSAVAAAGTSGKATTSLILGLASLLCNCLTGLPGLILGIIALTDISSKQGRLKGKGLAIMGILFSVLLPVIQIVAIVVWFTVSGAPILGGAIGEARQVALGQNVSNNQKQAALAMHNFNSVTNKFPAIGNSPEIKAGLSWRVHLLPYLEEHNTYDLFIKEEGWESSANLSAASNMPAVFGSPEEPFSDRATLNSIVSATPSGQTKLGVEDGASFSNISDGSSNTIMFVEIESGRALGLWSGGFDHEVDLNNPASGLRARGDKFIVTFVDGSNRRISSDLSPEVLKALMTRNGNEVVDPFDLQ